MRFNIGWLKWHRGNEWMQAPMKGFWVTLLEQAAVKHARIFSHRLNRFVTLNRGDIWTTTRNLSEDTGLDRRTVARFLAILSEDGAISTEKTRAGTFIKINNYSKYQSKSISQEDKTTAQYTAESTAQYTSSKERKKERKICTEPRENPAFLEAATNALGKELTTDLQTKKIKAKRMVDWLRTYDDDAWVRMEIQKAIGWCADNPSRKPKSQWGRFVSSWLSRGWEYRRKLNPNNVVAFPERKIDESAWD